VVTHSELYKKGELVFEFAGKQLTRLVKTYPDMFPTFTLKGKWKTQVEGWTKWCEGFLGGILWLVYMQTGEVWFRQQAEHYSQLVEWRKSDKETHDLGFIFWPTWKRWYDLTGEKTLNQVLIEAGCTLAQRFQKKGGYLCSFEGADSLYIDIMMNVGLVFYTAQQTGNETLWQIAHRHCLTTRRTLVRGDGSTAHEGIFDLESGEFLRQTTKQGWRGDSTWARGLTWALYGFGMAYHFTQDMRFLDTAKALANFYMERTASHGVPPNDWEEPNPPYSYESSAAAIAACGFWNLANLCDGTESACLYHDYALRILDTLSTTNFLANETPGWEGILLHGIYHYPKAVGLDESLIWGDYYLLEAFYMFMQGAALI